jgi:predicted KAP-like P-loop ATPase
VTAPELKETARNTVTRLFPKLKGVWGNYRYGSDVLGQWQRECRAASPEILPTYFRLSLPSRTFSRERTKAIINKASNLNVLCKEISRLQDQKLPDGRTAVAIFLERAANLVEDLRLNETDIINLITAVLEDKLVKIADTSRIVGFPIDNRWRIISLVFSLLRKFDADQRLTLIKSAINIAIGTFLIVDVVATLEEEHESQGSAGSTKEPLLAKSDCEELVGMARAQIVRAAQSNELADVPSLGRILWIWQRWAPEEAKKWIDSLVAKDEGLLRLVDTSIGEGLQSSVDDPVAETFTSVNIIGLSKLIDLQSFSKRFQLLSSHRNITEKRRLALGEILKHLESTRSSASSN